ncbi:vesicle-associated membrane protein 8 [Hyalella azteca]|uniref:Vesicle-associated membrane protein 8 n=1 Tax=Hyalella azteca TaxID=294128 RepID=A0A8B7NH24_HYAAZ|nr:vesicle-associated membrane protein 8 [Hyalella azteca]
MMEADEGGINPSAGGSNPFGEPREPPQNDALERTKRQVEEVKSIMGENVQRVIARGETLENLDARAANLTANASEFQRTSRSLQRKMWWKNIKMWLILGLIAIIIIVIIIIAAVPPKTTPTVTPSAGALQP